MDVMEGTATTLAAGDVFVLTADRPMSTEHAQRLHAFVSAALPEGVRVLILDPGLSFEVLPRPLGVSRVADNDRALLISFRGVPSDDALRGLLDILKGIAPRGLTYISNDKIDARHLGSADMDAAAIAQFANDLAGMSPAKVQDAIRDAEAKINEEEPWLEALVARMRQFDEAAKHPVTYHVTEEGEPWAVYREGAWPAEAITRQDVIDAMNLYGSGDGDDWGKDNPELPTVTTFYVTGERPEPESTKRRKGDDDDDAPLDDLGVWFCDAGAPGAYPVTGFKLFGG